jgi:hypothetical protein
VVDDNTGYLVKYIDPVSKLIHLTLSSDLFVWDVISNPPIRTELDFKPSRFDPAGLALGRDQIDLFPYEWNFDLDMPGQNIHHSLKEHHKITNIPKFRCEML